MRVRVDPELCVGHGRCYDIAPGVFDEDPRGHCRIRHEKVPAGLEDEARLAADNCPESAIAIDEG